MPAIIIPEYRIIMSVFPGSVCVCKPNTVGRSTVGFHPVSQCKLFCIIRHVRVAAPHLLIYVSYKNDIQTYWRYSDIFRHILFDQRPSWRATQNIYFHVWITKIKPLVIPPVRACPHPPGGACLIGGIFRQRRRCLLPRSKYPVAMQRQS